MAHVLIVDDDEGIRSTLTFAIEEEGYTVAEAVNGKLALEHLRATTERWVVLLDSIMPVMDGGSVLRAVADEPALAERHAYIFLTALSPSAQQPLGDILRQLHVPVLAKPFDITQLLDAVANCASHL